MATVQDLAGQMSEHFEQATRNNGENYWRRKDGSPDWMQEICRDAHGDLMPDDWRYEFIHEAVDALWEQDDEDTALECIQADTYTEELTRWLHSNVNRVYYLSEVLEEGTNPDDGFALLAEAQYREKSEVFFDVKAALEHMALNGTPVHVA